MRYVVKNAGLAADRMRNISFQGSFDKSLRLLGEYRMIFLQLYRGYGCNSKIIPANGGNVIVIESENPMQLCATLLMLPMLPWLLPP